MSISSFLTALRRGWIIVGVTALLAVLASLILSLVTTPVYDSTARIFVSTRVSNLDANQLSQGSTFSSDRVKSYAALAQSPSVVEQVASAGGRTESLSALTDRVSAEAPPGTVLVDVSASDETASGAAALSNAVADVLSKTIEQLEAPTGGGPSPVKATVVARAEPPGAASWPNTPVNVVVGLLIGLALGIAGALIRSVTDTTIRSTEELRTATPKPVLGSVALTGDGSGSGAYRRPPQSITSEEFKFIRTNLQFASVDSERRSLFVTSSVQGEGKTFISCNLAWALADQGYKVCLVDADLRRPAVHTRLNVVGDVGLTSVLLGRSNVAHVAQSVRHGLSVIAAGPLPPNPSELLSSKQMAIIVGELEKTYDFVLFDCAPALPVPDVLVLSSLVKDGLFVFRARSTSRKQLNEALGLLDGANAKVAGIVLNMAGAEGKTYGYSYGDTGNSRTNRPEMPQPDTTVTISQSNR